MVSVSGIAANNAIHQAVCQSVPIGIDLSPILAGARAPYKNTVPAMAMTVASTNEILAQGFTGTTRACEATFNSNINTY